MQAKTLTFIVEGALHEHYVMVMAALRFEWDARKSAGNARKHGVTFEEAQSAFADPDGKVIDDPDHPDEEDRYILLAFSYSLRLLVVVHTQREASDVIRIISARRATPGEATSYRRSRGPCERSTTSPLRGRIPMPRG